MRDVNIDVTELFFKNHSPEKEKGKQTKWERSLFRIQKNSGKRQILIKSFSSPLVGSVMMFLKKKMTFSQTHFQKNVSADPVKMLGNILPPFSAFHQTYRRNLHAYLVCLLIISLKLKHVRVVLLGESRANEAQK